jgi:predicted nucleotide-binding protein (sugar kinase/HSP70/actin superfamily)
LEIDDGEWRVENAELRVEIEKQRIKKNIVIGLNRSFQINTLYPMFSTFFNELGLKIVMPDHATEDGIDKGLTSFCLSGQISLGMFDSLLKLEPDYIFMPQIMELHVSKQEEYRKEYQTVCMFVQGEPFYQQASFFKNLEREGKKIPKMITPALNLMSGYDSEEKTFVKIATDLGFSKEDGKKAHQKAVDAQLDFFKKMKEEGKRILTELEKEPNKRAIVLFGRPYNAFANETNKGVPFKFASRGVEIIPYDFLLYEDEENYKKTYWEMGQRIIKAARIVKRHPQLFACYLTNFLCALDSMMIPHFRDLMGTKPSLTIEVDGHTADAGVNTRIEAFMDVINNYVKIRDNIKDKKSDFVMARTEIDNRGKTIYIDSEGKKFSFKDKTNVKVVVPSMGDLFAEGSAAVLRRQGWNAHALPVCDREALDLGRSVTTSKECLPIINIIGELLKYLKYRENKNEKLVIFLVSAGGCCRVGQYEILAKTIIEKQELKDVALITLENDSGYAGLGMDFRINAGRIIFAGDILDDIRSVIKAMSENRERDLSIFREEWLKIIDVMEKKGNFYKQLKETAKRFKDEIRLVSPLKEAKYVGVVGEIFVRRDHFSLMGIPEKLAKNGFVMLDAHVTEWLRYVEFLQNINMFEIKTNFVGKIESALSTIIMDIIEKKIKNIFVKSGLYEKEILDIKKYMEHSSHIFPWTLTGEPGLSTGASMYHLLDKYCGVINVGPFGCMNSRMTEGVTSAYMNVEGKEDAVKKAKKDFDVSNFKENIDILPFLSVECDGNPFSQILEARLETFMLQANRAYKEMQGV